MSSSWFSNSQISQPAAPTCPVVNAARKCWVASIPAAYQTVLLDVAWDGSTSATFAIPRNRPNDHTFNLSTDMLGLDWVFDAARGLLFFPYGFEPTGKAAVWTLAPSPDGNNCQEWTAVEVAICFECGDCAEIRAQAQTALGQFYCLTAIVSTTLNAAMADLQAQYGSAVLLINDGGVGNASSFQLGANATPASWAGTANLSAGAWTLGRCSLAPVPAHPPASFTFNAAQPATFDVNSQQGNIPLHPPANITFTSGGGNTFDANTQLGNIDPSLFGGGSFTIADDATPTPAVETIASGEQINFIRGDGTVTKILPGDTVQTNVVLAGDQTQATGGFTIPNALSFATNGSQLELYSPIPDRRDLDVLANTVVSPTNYDLITLENDGLTIGVDAPTNPAIDNKLIGFVIKRPSWSVTLVPNGAFQIGYSSSLTIGPGAASAQVPDQGYVIWLRWNTVQGLYQVV